MLPSQSRLVCYGLRNGDINPSILGRGVVVTPVKLRQISVGIVERLRDDSPRSIPAQKSCVSTTDKDGKDVGAKLSGELGHGIRSDLAFGISAGLGVVFNRIRSIITKSIIMCLTLEL